MGDNIFLEQMKEIRFEDYFKYDAGSRGNLGDQLPVMVYRLLEYSLKEELKKRYGKESQRISPITASRAAIRRRNWLKS